jgi:hypothetical protein
MYSVNRFSHERHGSVVLIERVENGSFPTPFQAVQAALRERRLWQEAGTKKVRILVDDQVMSPKQAESWAHDEYKSSIRIGFLAAISSAQSLVLIRTTWKKWRR